MPVYVVVASGAVITIPDVVVEIVKPVVLRDIPA